MKASSLAPPAEMNVIENTCTRLSQETSRGSARFPRFLNSWSGKEESNSSKPCCFQIQYMWLVVKHRFLFWDRVRSSTISRDIFLRKNDVWAIDKNHYFILFNWSASTRENKWNGIRCQPIWSFQSISVLLWWILLDYRISYHVVLLINGYSGAYVCMFHTTWHANFYSQ
jgi:hypothetical protein